MGSSINGLVDGFNAYIDHFGGVEAASNSIWDSIVDSGGSFFIVQSAVSNKTLNEIQNMRKVYYVLARWNFDRSVPASALRFLP